MVGECFPKHNTHDYVPDPHKPGFLICRHCADRKPTPLIELVRDKLSKEEPKP